MNMYLHRDSVYVIFFLFYIESCWMRTPQLDVRGATSNSDAFFVSKDGDQGWMDGRKERRISGLKTVLISLENLK